MKDRFLSMVILVCLLVSMSFFMYSCMNVSSGGYSGGKDRIAILRIEGVITSGKAAQGLFQSTGTFSDSVVTELRKVVEEDGIKALVVRINSPGGSAAASEEIFNAIMEVKDAGKPVVVSMADVAASGGYFVAAPADVIYANASTLTGSIGVIMELPLFEGLFEKIGVDMRTMKAGELKDIASPYREMTTEEEEILQELLNGTHEIFMDYVARGRGMDIEEVRELATGRIYSGLQALDVGLVDKLGGLREAINEAAALAGIEGEPVIDELGEFNFLDELFGIEEMGPSPIPLDRLSILARLTFLNPLLLDENFTHLYR